MKSQIPGLLSDVAATPTIRRETGKRLSINIF